ncbi:MAG: hypothetical protein IKY21_06355 [Clostridia bacterium]|nr:hypothetical protein [Clostridia bacterium]
MANYKSPNLEDGEKEEGKKKIRPKATHKALIAVHKWNFVFYFVVMIVSSGIGILFGIGITEIFDFEKSTDMVIIYVFGSLPVIVCVILIVLEYIKMKQTVGGSYSLITDTIERVVTDDKYVYRRRMHGWSGYYEHAMYLYRCGRVVISLEETYLNSEGDACYVLVYDDKPNKPIAVYNTKFYELDDIEETTEE